MTTERRKQAFKLRSEGLTYRAIGIELGVSPSRARSLVLSHEKDTARSEGFGTLSTRTINISQALGYKNLDSLRLAFIENKLDLSEFEPKARAELCSVCGITAHQDKEADTDVIKATALLTKLGYTVLPPEWKANMAGRLKANVAAIIEGEPN